MTDSTPHALPLALAELARRRQEEADPAPPVIPDAGSGGLESRPPLSSGSTDSADHDNGGE